MWRQGQHPPSNSANTMKSENNEDVSDTVLTYGSHLPGDDTNSENITRPDALDHPGSQVGLHDASQDANTLKSWSQLTGLGHPSTHREDTMFSLRQQRKN